MDGIWTSQYVGSIVGLEISMHTVYDVSVVKGGGCGACCEET